jgi:hypothetical protein
VDCTSAAAESKVVKFAKALSTALSQASDCELIELIADALGHMAKNSPVSHVDYLELELNRSLDWLKGHRNSFNRRFAACTVLQQLAKNARTVFFARIHEFFDLIWAPIWDQREPIRLAASRALSACLAVLRERTYHLQWYCLIYDQLQDGLMNGSEEFVHGSILVLTEVLRYTGDFMMPRFKETCKNIMGLKDHKSRIVKSAIVTLLPSLASLSPDAFARAHMDESIEFLLKCSRANNQELKPQALLSTGKLCLAMGTHLVTRIDELMNIVKEAFGLPTSTSSNKKSSKTHNPEVIPEALVCISDMVTGLGLPFHTKVYPLLEPMLQSGLTSELISTLSVICHHMPTQKHFVQSRLLEEATKVLGGECKPTLQDPPYVYSWSKKGERHTRQSYLLHGLGQPGNMHGNNGLGSIAGGMSSNALSAMMMTTGGNSTSQTTVNTGSSLTNEFAASLDNILGGNILVPQTTRGSISLPRTGGNTGMGTNLRGATASPAPPPPQTPTSSNSVSNALTGSTSKSATKSATKKSSFFSLNPLKSSTTTKTPVVPVNLGVLAIGNGLGLKNEFDESPLLTDVTQQSAHEIALIALRTLASLSISPFNLINIVQQSVLPYFIADDYLVRKEAAVTCAKIISSLIGGGGTGVGMGQSSQSHGGHGHRGGSGAAIAIATGAGAGGVHGPNSVSSTHSSGNSLQRSNTPPSSTIQHTMGAVVMASPTSVAHNPHLTWNTLPFRKKGPTANAVEEIISRLLEVTVSDTSIQVRLATLKAMTKEFDSYLSRSHHIDTLMLLLADESFDIRLESLSILGRLSALNPAAILPAIRIHFTRLISELQNNPDFRLIEEAATMICNFMKFPKFHFLVKPVMATILESLPLTGYDVRATTAALETLGELSVVLQSELLPYVDTLLPVIIMHMFDNSSLKKQQVAIRTLGQLVKSTGMVVRPYLQYPQLLPKTLELLCKDSSNKPMSFRMELLRVLGLVGALEPSRYSAIVSFLQANARKTKKNENGNEGNDGNENNNNGTNKVDNKKLLNNVSSLYPLPGSSIERDLPLKLGYGVMGKLKARQQQRILLKDVDENNKDDGNTGVGGGGVGGGVGGTGGVGGVGVGGVGGGGGVGGVGGTNATARERAESNVSFMDKANPLNGNGNGTTGGGGGGEKGGYGADARRGSGVGVNDLIDPDDIIQTKQLLYGDSADAPCHVYMYELSMTRALSEPPQEKMITAKHSPNSEDFYPRVALSVLVKILQDQTLTIHHSTATQTIVQIFCSLGVRCVPYLEHIFPYFFQVSLYSYFVWFHCNF